MGRRALRKIDPALDLSHHLLAWDQLPTPWDTEALFGRHAPLEIEIGSGKGLFMETACRATPDHDFLGIETVGKYARFSAARLARHRFDNGRMLHGDGVRLFRELLPTACAVAVHVYFPDPWWKKRHHKRRVLNARLLTDVERVLVPGGSLHVWTDVKDYFDATLQLLAEVSPLEGPLDVPERPVEHPLDYRTHFERRVRMAGEAVYRCEYRKTRIE